MANLRQLIMINPMKEIDLSLLFLLGRNVGILAGAILAAMITQWIIVRVFKSQRLFRSDLIKAVITRIAQPLNANSVTSKG